MRAKWHKVMGFFFSLNLLDNYVDSSFLLVHTCTAVVPSIISFLNRERCVGIILVQMKTQHVLMLITPSYNWNLHYRSNICFFVLCKKFVPYFKLCWIYWVSGICLAACTTVCNLISMHLLDTYAMHYGDWEEVKLIVVEFLVI